MDNSEKSNTGVFENCVKERSTNFNKSEVDRLSSLIEKYKYILFCKKTDGVSIKQKESAWGRIEKEFNAVGEIPRTIKQLKYKFENLKRTVKKDATRERQQMIRTGGGRLTPPSPSRSEHDSDAKDLLKSLMSSHMHGNAAIYDDDVIAKRPKCSQDFTIEFIDGVKDLNPAEQLQTAMSKEDNGDVEKMSSSDRFDTSTPYSSLKRPVSSPLRRLAKNKSEGSYIQRALQEKKIAVLSDLHQLELDKIKESVSQQRELHQQNMKHNEEKHKLEVMKLELEIEILKNKKEQLKKE